MAITDDGHCVQNNELMRRALEYARMFDLPVMDHCQDYSLVTDGVMHEGYWSTVAGLARLAVGGRGDDCRAQHSPGRNHRGARALPAFERRWQRSIAAGGQETRVPISGEACPHHFTLTDAAMAGSEKFWQHRRQRIFGFDGRTASDRNGRRMIPISK